jgi:hypothetical protein
MNKQFIQGEINTGEEQFINSSIMSQACDIAEKLTELECKLNGIQCYVSEMEGETEVLSYTEDAQDIFNDYYDQYTEELYELLNQQLHAIKA